MTDGRSSRSPAEPPAAALKRHSIALVTERLPFKAGALFFALVLWLIVSAEEPTQQVVPVTFQPLPDTMITFATAPPDVRALVIGRARDLLQLYSTPPVIRRLVRADVGDTVTIELRPEDVDLPPDIDAIVRDVQPRQVTLRFSATMQRELPVQSLLTLVADTGFVIVGPPRFEPDRVTIIGDRRVVPTLHAVPTIAGQLWIRDTTALRIPLDTSRLGVRAQPSTVLMRVPVIRDTTIRADTAASAADARSRR